MGDYESTIVHMMKQHELGSIHRELTILSASITHGPQGYRGLNADSSTIWFSESCWNPLCCASRLSLRHSIETIVQLKRRRAKIEESVNKSLDVSNLSPRFVHN